MSTRFHTKILRCFISKIQSSMKAVTDAALFTLQVDLTELVDFFVKPGKFKRSGARIPKGVLLCGPPGTGKTLLARAVAGEARVAFLSLNASEFVEMFAGLGASRVRDLFNQVTRPYKAYSLIVAI